MNGVVLAAMTLGVAAAACSDAATCPSLDGVRERMRQAPAFVPSDRPRVSTIDGEGRFDRAIVVRLVPGKDVTDLSIEVDGRAHTWPTIGPLPSASTMEPVLVDVDAALAAGRPRVIEVDAPGRTGAFPLMELLVSLAPRGEVRLLVDEVIQPPYERMPSWAITAADSQSADREGPSTIAEAIRRAAGERCHAELEFYVANARALDGAREDAELRAAVTDALVECKCRGADVNTLSWLYEQLVFPRLRAGWLRVQLLQTGKPAPGKRVRDANDIAKRLGAIPAAARAAGVRLEMGL